MRTRRDRQGFASEGLFPPNVRTWDEGFGWTNGVVTAMMGHYHLEDGNLSVDPAN